MMKIKARLLFTGKKHDSLAHFQGELTENHISYLNLPRGIQPLPLLSKWSKRLQSYSLRQRSESTLPLNASITLSNTN